MRLLFSFGASSDVSEAMLSRFTPATPEALLMEPLLPVAEPPGVWGGVGPKVYEPAAAMDGTLLMEGVGLFMAGGAFWSGGWAKLDCVAALEADMLRAGEAGRAGFVKGDADGAGGGAIEPLLLAGFEGCLEIAGTAGAAVGVACGVEAAEFARATEIGVGVCRTVLTGWCTVPSSPGAKHNAEQKPSEEVINSV